jgi:hypothetical protein
MWKKILGKNRRGERNSILMRWMCEQRPLHVAVSATKMYFAFEIHNSM